jgi:glycosyltransferase involved in cell wall biosynthesis
MHVVLVGTGVQPIPPPGYGGVERTIAELGRALERAGASVTIVQRVRRGRSVDEYLFARELPRLLPDDPAAIVHASTPVVANRLALLGRRYVYTSHSRHWFDRHGLRQHWGAYLERRAVHRSARTVALTERLRAAMLAQCGDSVAPKLTIIPIGVDPEKFRPDPARWRGTLAVGVGIVAPVKRWEVAAQALRGTGWALRIAGPVRDAAYARLVESSGDDVQLVGELPEESLTRLLAGADLCLHPSRVELLAGAVLQAMASGLPVLGADPVAGLVHDGETGAIAPPGLTDRALADWMHDRVLELQAAPDRLRAWGTNARELAVREYSWSAVAAAHLALYGRLDGGGRG